MSSESKYAYRPVEFELPTPDGFVISGFVHIGRNEDLPIVLIGHGWGDGVDHNVPMEAARMLAIEGYSTFRYTSSRPIETCTVQDSARDVDQLVTAIRYWSPFTTVGYLGHSRAVLEAFASRQLFDFVVGIEGSHPAALHAAHPAWRPDAADPDFSNDVTTRIGDDGPWRADWGGQDQILATSEVWQSGLAFDLNTHAAKFSGPVLYIAAGKGTLTPYIYDLALLSPHPESIIRVVGNATHNMTEPGAMVRAMSYFADWMDRLMAQKTLTAIEPDDEGERPGLRIGKGFEL